MVSKGITVAIISIALQYAITGFVVKASYPKSKSFAIGLFTAFISAVVSFVVSVVLAYVLNSNAYILSSGLAILLNFILSPFITKAKIKKYEMEQ